MSAPNTDRNLLIGILALQMELIDREQLLAATNLWLQNKQRPLREILVETGALRELDADRLIPLVADHIKIHDGDELATIVALQSNRNVQVALRSSNEVNIADTAPLSDSVALDNLTQDLAQETIHSDTANPATDSKSGKSRFKVLRFHARGGLGEVSVALDTELGREVALKEIRPRLAFDDESRSRFLLEAQVTGGLEHPGIVPVYGLNNHEDGRPYYAMRFIRGESLEQAANALHRNPDNSSQQPTIEFGSLEFRKLLGRFIDVCNAIEYAHSRGVLHRDLKPGNVMLGKFGETLVVDWGLAKVAEGPDAKHPDDNSPLPLGSHVAVDATHLGTAIGTPAFMPPEQAEGRLDELGPASDVYALGGTLYYLLTGQRPCQGKDVQETLEKAKRGMVSKPTSVRPEIPKSLEAICLKALSMRPADRYARPRLLANDLERFLADEPVTACVEPLSVRTKRWLRKHPRTVASVAATLLIGAISSIAIAAVVMNSNRLLAEANRDESEAREQAEQNARQLILANQEITQKELEARRQRDVAIAISDFVQEDMLLQAAPSLEPDREIQFRTVLDRATASIGQRFRDSPLVEIAISTTLGNAYHQLGALDKAEPLLLRANELAIANLGEEHIRSVNAMNNLAVLYATQGRFDEADSLYTKSLEVKQRILGDTDDFTLTTMSNQGDLLRQQGRFEEAERILVRAADTCRRELGMQSLVTQKCIGNLAILLGDLGRLRESLELRLEILEASRSQFGNEHPATLNAIGNVGTAYLELGDAQQAVQFLREDLETSRRVLGEDHYDTLITENNLALALKKLGKFKEAEDLYNHALTLGPRVYGEDHPTTLGTMSNLASVYKDTGRLDEAADIYRRVLDAQRQRVGDDHPDTLVAMANLAESHRLKGQFREAADLYEPALESMRRVFGDEHPNTLSAMANLGNTYYSLGRPEDVEPLWLEALETSKRLLGDEHPSTLTYMSNLAVFYRIQGRLDEAEPLHLAALQIRERILGSEHPSTLVTMATLAGLYQAQNRFAEAEAMFTRAVEADLRVLGLEHPTTLTAMHNFGMLLMSMGKLSQAEQLFQTCIEAKQRVLGAEHPNLADSVFALAQLRFRQGRYRESEPLYLKAMEIRRKALGNDHPRSMSVARGLARLYVTQERFDEALPLLVEVYQLANRRLGIIHPISVSVSADLALAYLRSGDDEQGRSMFERFVDGQRKLLQEDQLALAALLEQVASSLLEHGQYVAAESYLRESIEIRETAMFESWQVFHAHSLLGEALMGQQRMDSAEELLLECCSSLMARVDDIPRQSRHVLTQAHLRLVELYDAWDQPQKAEKWRAELATLMQELGILYRPETNVRPPRPLAGSAEN